MLAACQPHADPIPPLINTALRTPCGSAKLGVSHCEQCVCVGGGGGQPHPTWSSATIKTTWGLVLLELLELFAVAAHARPASTVPAKFMAARFPQQQVVSHSSSSSRSEDGCAGLLVPVCWVASGTGVSCTRRLCALLCLQPKFFC